MKVSKKKKDAPESITNKYHQAVTLLKAAVAVMSINTNITTELAGLREEVARLAAAQPSVYKQPSADTQATISNVPVMENILITGSGASSPEAYQQMIGRAWSGRLGRTHMADVDRMLVSVRSELDCYLRRTIHKMFPVGGNYVSVNSDTVFATLAAFGLRLEDRGPLADVTIFNDQQNSNKPTLSRMQNFGAVYYRRGENYDSYWKGSAMETLIELARYRGLFNNEGFLGA